MIKKSTAQIVSYAFNPVFMTFVVLIGALAKTPMGQKGLWAAIIVGANIIAPLLFIAILMKMGFAIDDTLQNPKVKRERIYAIAPLIIIGLAEWWYGHNKDVGQPLLATLAASTLLIIAVAVISYGWKISVHMTSVSGLVFMLTLIFGLTMAWTLIFIPLVSWSRRQLQRHTPAQIVGGILLAPAIIIPVFRFFKLI